uniref:Uncharacterized protein n=1 Tax=Glossina austeni TaxID=7395 RepID=A0A1A9V2Q5_GLOAU
MQHVRVRVDAHSMLQPPNSPLQDCVDVSTYSALSRSNGNRLYYITTHLHYRIVLICEQPSFALINQVSEKYIFIKDENLVKYYEEILTINMSTITIQHQQQQ